MNSKEIIVEKKWSFLLIFLIIFFNPCFLFWADNLMLTEKCKVLITCFFVFGALFGICFFLKKKAEKLFLGILFLLSLTPNTVVWSYLYMSNTYMYRDMFWVLFGSNVSESKEYFEQFISWKMYAMALLYIATGLLFLFKSGTSHSLSMRKYGVFFILCILIVVASFSFQYLTSGISTFDYYVSGIKYVHESSRMKDEFKMRKRMPVRILCTLPDSTRQVFVVVLGESLTRTHMHMYGYFRETTPRMDAIQHELDIYRDVVTPDTHTIGVLKKVLTFADHGHPHDYANKPSVVELFESAGFQTYWVSNQEFLSKWGGSYGVIAAEADHVYNLRIAQKNDEVILPVLQTILEDTVISRKIIFVHLMGSHHLYSARYPKEFNYFDYRKDPIPDKAFLNDGKRKTIDAYDNSVRYTDYIVDSIIKQVESIHRSSFVLFLSDHGEEVFDVRDASGHHMSNVYSGQCEIPFILWRSEKYKKENPGIIINTMRPYTIDYLIHSLSNLAGLSYKDYRPEYSVFSEEYKPLDKRWVGSEVYEDILKKKY